ncbi:urease accessory protein UreD [Arthrobacter sp. H14-L1]|uniref:urease accessory protein UreD n=1 Tax=Arthrobacter sp. H14-L1 TaxID=2996697 RepID=UPI00226EF00B|nr:urease accessory protein UreD [Arthrobacter sp. H14-L1]MCY0905955.1 urease accessory protein UreD [Arthrobacter sp. H14-L1]
MSALLTDPAVKAPMGELRLDIGIRSGRSLAIGQYHRGALRVLRPHYLDESGQVCYVTVNQGGAYLGGDLFTMDITVAEGARLLLTTQSATKIYRTPKAFAEQRLTVSLGPDSTLEYVPDQLIAYRGAAYRQGTLINMDESSSLIMSEVITPGWSPDGQPFKYEQLRLRNEIRYGGRLLAIDNVLLTPPSAGTADISGQPVADITGLGFMEGFSHLGSLLVVDPRVDAALVTELRILLGDHEQDALTGISQLNGPGFVVRALSGSTSGLNIMMSALTSLLRERWFGQAPLNLRKH